MYEVWGMAALWLALALIATLFSIWFCIATALSEIIIYELLRNWQLEH